MAKRKWLVSQLLHRPEMEKSVGGGLNMCQQGRMASTVCKRWSAGDRVVSEYSVVTGVRTRIPRLNSLQHGFSVIIQPLVVP